MILNRLIHFLIYYRIISICEIYNAQNSLALAHKVCTAL